MFVVPKQYILAPYMGHSKEFILATYMGHRNEFTLAPYMGQSNELRPCCKHAQDQREDDTTANIAAERRVLQRIYLTKQMRWRHFQATEAYSRKSLESRRHRQRK